MHVEWYYEDFSDPEAVSGSSTNIFCVKNAKMGVFCALKINVHVNAKCQKYVFRF